jgi:predicted glycoside hydrolase/deacetylase ChbG (UPF0249 family)
MLIINADDWGLNKIATDNSLACFKNGRITSASAMVFMHDSERSAVLALDNGFDVGLHLNFTQRFDGDIRAPKLVESHRKVAQFLNTSRYARLLYNPILKSDFEYQFQAQYDEFWRLYKREPTHINGHKHMHLCMNVVFSDIMPSGLSVRRNFTFFPGSKNVFNRLYRRIVDFVLMRRYGCTDWFFKLVLNQTQKMRKVVNLARNSCVELMVHPERNEEFEYLMSDEFYRLISPIDKCNYNVVGHKNRLEAS